MFKLTGAKLRLDAQASLYHAACTQYNDIIQLFFFFLSFFLMLLTWQKYTVLRF